MSGKKRQKQLCVFQESININFKDLEILNAAFVHPSVTNERTSSYISNNQRLEFLGDAVLELVVSDYLYKNHPDLTEGEMTQLRAFTVCEPSLAKIAQKLELGQLLLLGKGEENTKGREKASILADTFEALIGAIYVDKGLEKARHFILENIKPIISQAIKGEHVKDYKTNLQEILQKVNTKEILYKVVRETGPDHDKMFYVEVLVDNKIMGYGSGKSKKQAEQKAAEEALKIMKHWKI